jgi:RES domain-containing protein
VIIVHRVASIDAFPGLEPKRYAGRWHLAGDKIIYFASTAAGAVLEKIAHAETDPATLRDTVWQLWSYAFPESLEIADLAPPPQGWEANWPACQKLTRRWQASGPAGLWVPSAVAPTERNLIVHPERLTSPAKSIVRSFRPDQRIADPALRRIGPPDQR